MILRGKSIIVLLLAGLAAASAREPEFGEFRAVQESLSGVHPRMRASWLREHGLDNSYYTTFRKPDSQGLTCIGRWPWGPSWETCGQDSLLFLGSGSGVRILTITDSVHPRMVGQINARGLINQLVVQDSLLFVACGSWGAQVYSVSDPASPRELGSMDAVIGDLTVKDTLCYTLGGDSFRIFNVANPTQPLQLDALRDSGDVIAVTNGHAFLGGRWVMNVIDVTDPFSPRWVSSRGGEYTVLFARNNLLYYVSGIPFAFVILDVSNPLNIRELGRVNDVGGPGLYIGRWFAYLSTEPGCPGGGRTFYVINVSDSTHPVVRGSCELEGQPWDPFVFSPLTYAYLADDFGGLKVISLHSVTAPQVVADAFKAHLAYQVTVAGNIGYVANDGAGMIVLDLTHPSFPMTLGTYDTLGGGPGTITVAAKDSFTYITWVAGRKLRVVDVSDPVNPVFAGQAQTFGFPEHIVLCDTLAYSAEASRFEVFNVARPRQPELVGSCVSADMTAGGLSLEGSFAYIASSIDGFQIVNIADPRNPWVMKTIPELRTWGCDVVDTIAYVADFDDSLHIWSVANPHAPYQISSVPVNGSAADVVVSSRYAYVACRDLRVVDICDPRNPVVVSSASTPYSVRRVSYDSSHVYAACYWAGVCIFDTFTSSVAEEKQPHRHGRWVRVNRTVVEDNVTIEFCGTVGEKLTIHVYSVTGRQVKRPSAVRVQKHGLQQRMVGLKGLSAGVYVINTTLGGKAYALRIVKVQRR